MYINHISKRSCMKLSTSVMVLLCAVSAGSVAYAAPTFHFKNKSKEAIYISLWQNGRPLVLKKKVSKSGTLLADPDMTLPTKLEINVCATVDACDAEHDALTVNFEVGNYKKIYVKFNGAHVLPQKGVGNKEGKGRSQNLLYSLENNINGGYIEE